MTRTQICICVEMKRVSEGGRRRKGRGKTHNVARTSEIEVRPDTSGPSEDLD
jgi:hypothetical protein